MPVGKRVICQLVKSGWLKREFLVDLAGETKTLVYNGREAGYEHVYVDGVRVAGGSSLWWFIPRFDFGLDGHWITVHVSIWPWMTIRKFRIEVDDRIVYQE
ncbi:MAG TPA: hypothetical protein PLV45_14515 [bacterium]|nr:hypothetical protein [bacterium]